MSTLTSVVEVYLFLLPIVQISFLGWIFLKTKRLAAICYLIYLIIYPLFVGRFFAQILANIQNNNTNLQIAPGMGEQSNIAIYFIRAIDSTIHVALFMWLLYSLLKLSRRKKQSSES
jgi:hypothetical protein